MAKYKVGDVVSTEHPDKWPILVEILKILPYNGSFGRPMYEVKVLDAVHDYKSRIGETDTFDQKAIDKDWEYDKVFEAAKQFDNDLENLLKE
jgi:hypothetical protein